MEMIVWDRVSFSYPGEETPALKEISGKVPRGSFTLLCGPTGSGKTTLLKTLKKEMTPIGKLSGEIRVFRRSPREWFAGEIGYVAQDPDTQLVMDTVERELAFGLENLGLPVPVIHRRMAEIASFFGIEGWLSKKTTDLSGGEKQLLNLASVMAMQPEILLLDEPTAQLDPIAAGNFLGILDRVHRELGMTIVMTEHRMNFLLSRAEQVFYLEKGALAFQGASQGLLSWLKKENRMFWQAMPEPVRLAGRLGAVEDFPLSAQEGREWLSGRALEKVVISGEPMEDTEAREPVLRAKNVWYSYKDGNGFAVEDGSLTLYQGEICGILGGNGSGKSTLLKLLSGVIRPVRGRIKQSKGLRVSLLPQNPRAVFTGDTLWEELWEWQRSRGYTEEDIHRILELLGLESYRNRHPYDLSGGEQQKAALAKLLLGKPDVLLLDEPEKGMDGIARQELSHLLGRLKKEGKTIAFVTHDSGFAAGTADRCAFVSKGSVVCCQETREFFSGNLFYTTDTARMCRGILEHVILPEDACLLGQAEERLE